MDQRQRSYLAGGVLLVLIGVGLLVFQTVPELQKLLTLRDTGPLIVVGVGVGLLIFGLLINAPGMAVPAMIVGGIGGILLWQNVTGHWGSWSYMWALIPGFVGVGIVLAGLISGEGIAEALRSGLVLITTSIVLFAIFGTFFGAFAFQEPYWPWVLIVLGAGLIIISWWRSPS
ncbi:MAG: hypothetical protein K6T71_04730 [Candidatus Bipolaricaulota bacterium]|nr:hypothetical protein [Candidatus Bipolaricaulota bacterium]